MRITGLQVDGFGVWSALELNDLEKGLNVFYGPNEAGKTTLMQFVRTVLYGFSPQRRRYLPPVHGGRPGGTLSVAGPHGRVRIRRHLSPHGLEGPERLELAGPDGALPEEHLAKALLSDVDEAVFNNVFAVGLRELQELGTLNDTAAAAMLYNLSVGLDRVSVVDVVRELTASRSRLLSPGGEPCELAELFAERDRLRSELHEMQALTRRYGRLVAEQEKLDRETARLESAAERLRHESKVVDVALAVRDRWQRRSDLDQRLAALEPPDGAPEEALARIEEVNKRLVKHEAVAEELRSQLARIRDEASGLEINEALLRQAPRIEVLLEQDGWIGTLQGRISELEGEISELEGHLTSEKEKFGVQDGVTSQVVRSISPASLAALKQPAKMVRQAQRRLEEAKRDVQSGRETAESISLEIEAALEARGQSDLNQAMDRIGGLVAQLRRRVQVDERLDQIVRYRAELEEQSRGLLDQRVLPVWMILGLGAVFITGVVMILTRLFMPDASGGLLGWPLTALGIVAAVAAVAAKFLLERSASRRLDGCEQQLHMLESQIKHAKQERDELDRELPQGGGPIVSRLREAERELKSLEALVPLDARRTAVDEEAEAAQGRVREAESRLGTAQQQWRDVLATLGLPRNLSPRQVKGLVTGSDEMVDTGRRLELRYEELQQRTRELESLAARINRVADEAGLVLDTSDPVEQLHALAEHAAEQEMLLERRNELRGQARHVRRKKARHDALIRRLKQKRRETLKRIGAADEEQLRKLAAQVVRARELGRERDGVQREIDAALAGHCTEEEMAEQLDAHPGVRLMTHRDQLTKKREAVETELQSRFEQRGRLGGQRSALVEDRGPAQKRLELAMVEARLARAVRRWQTLAVSSRILDSIRSAYEQDRQPETLREASCYLERMTEGRYTRIWTPLDRDELLVDTADGKPLSVEFMSQGTREQLFVSLRLALAGSYARRGTHLPMVLDDVLVNFDNRRAKAAAAVLHDFAEEGHQVMVFTCHEHIAGLFRSLDVAVTDLPTGETTATARPVASKRSKRRRKPRRAPEPAAEPQLDPLPQPEPQRDVEPVEVEVETTAVVAERERSPVPDAMDAAGDDYDVGRPFEVDFDFVPWEEDVDLPESGTDPSAADEKSEPDDGDLDASDSDDDYQLVPLDDEEPPSGPRFPSPEYELADEIEDEPEGWDDRYTLFGDTEAA